MGNRAQPLLRRRGRRWRRRIWEEALPADVGLCVGVHPLGVPGRVGGEQGAAVLGRGVRVLLLAGRGRGRQLTTQRHLPLRPLGLQVVEPGCARTVVGRAGGVGGVALVVLVEDKDDDDNEDEDDGDEDADGHTHVLGLPPGLKHNHLVLEVDLGLDLGLASLNGGLTQDLVLLGLVVGLGLNEDRSWRRNNV